MSPSPHAVNLNPNGGISVDDHIVRAQHYFQANNIDTAICELSCAVTALKESQARVEHAVDRAITTLSTLGGRADPPHPKTLAFIKLKMTLAAT